MSGSDGPRSEVRRQAAATRRAAGPSTKLLSRPASPYLSPVDADSRFGPDGNVRPVLGYDEGQAAPPLPAEAPGRAVQHLTAAELLECMVADRAREDLVRSAPGMRGARVILEQLGGYPGDSWEERWISSGFDSAPRTWLAQLQTPVNSDIRYLTRGVNALLQARAFRPSYTWMLDSHYLSSREFLRSAGGPPFEKLRLLPDYLSALPRQQRDVDAGLMRVLIRTGKAIPQLTGDDLLYYADVVRTSGRSRREHLIWELLVRLGPLAGETATLRAAWSAKGNSRQYSTATLVGRYGIPPSGVRELLVDYLDELRPSMDYGSLEGLAFRLARLFWWEVTRINPEQKDLRLSPAVATAWRERLAQTADGRPRREIHSVLFAIRGLYRDLAEWSHDDPVRWGIWVAPCPVPRAESRATSKAKRRQQSRMQERTRTLIPLLPALVTAAQQQKARGALMLKRALAAAHGERFEIDGIRFERDSPPARYEYLDRCRIWARFMDGQERPRWLRGLRRSRIDVTAVEADSFWGWAVVETLRHTGVRIEELLELTQLSLRHYTAPATGTLVPLLHIVPSKTDCERLVPMTPELVQILLAVLRRAKGSDANVPLSIRYDPTEKIHGDPFPHLFARKVGTRQEVLSAHYIRGLLGNLAAIAGLADAGQPVHFTPHDFRRVFATDAVNGGLPLHIVAALLGHLNLDTTRGYTAVFPEHIVTAHQAFIERRRQLRPLGEDRVAEPDEWAEFEQHFLLRRVALGDCHRPYGTPCIHEHACTRCRFLRVDPAQLGRIEEMTTNAEARLVEAREKVWLGEVAAVEESLRHLRVRRDEARSRQANPDPLTASVGSE